MRERIAVYPGSFDPPTYGHLDLIERATKMFDRLIVGVAINNAKQCLFTPQERVVMLREVTSAIPHIEVQSFECLTVEFAQRCGAIALIRGLRAVSDFEYELMMAITNRKLHPEVDTVCLMPSEPHLFLSSRVAKEVAALGGDTGSFVPPAIARHLQKKLTSG